MPPRSFSIARAAVERPLYTWLLIFACLLGGLAGYVSVGKLEDPVFTLKSALVITFYPGATAAEVAIEVSEVLESEIQKMDEVDYITSNNSPGLSVIEVEMKPVYDGTELPQIWDDLRDRVADAIPMLAEGAAPPRINDSFGDVYGLHYAVSAPGYSDAEIWEIAAFLRREVLAVDGVADAELLGLPEEAVFVEPSSRQLRALAAPPTPLIEALAEATAVQATGSADAVGRNLRINAPEADDSVGGLSALTIGVGGDVVSLIDIASIERRRVDDPTQVIRHNGQDAFTLGVAGLQSENIVTVGAAVEARLAQARALLPVGVEVHPIYQQHDVVDQASNDFVFSLALSVSVVIAVLALFMGWRAALVVGGSLLLTVTATFIFMALFDIKVERISLGALIIAMGMLVDNAIVVAEGMQVRMRQGENAADAAAEVGRRTQVPLLGATIIGALAFVGIGLSPDATGEFLFSLFAVITISLLLSWVIAVSVTPLLGAYLFRQGAGGEENPYGGLLFRAYGRVVRLALRLRWLVIALLLGGTAACYAVFGTVTQQFFPPANTPLFYFNYKAAQGAKITRSQADLQVVEDWLLQRDDVAAVTATAGRSFTRFLLTYTPTDPDPSRGQLIIRAESFDAIPEIRDALSAFAADALPWAETRVEQIIYGPPVGADVEVRISGPDPDVLRALAQKAKAVFETATDKLHVERTDWRERELTTQPIFAADRARAIGVDRADVALAIALATDGIQVATLRERDRLIPIIMRTPRAEQTGDGQLLDQLLWAPVDGDYTTLAQAIDGFDVNVRDTLIERRDRVPTVSVQAFAVPGVLPSAAFADVRAAIEAIPTPPGYAMEWGGEHETAGDATTSLGVQMPLAFGAMVLVTVLLFGTLRQTAVIWTVVPMAANGVAIGLAATGLPFSFTALLGLLGLVGMLIKNAIVLVEETDALKTEEGMPQTEAIVAASVSRLRPVALAAATTILGMAPLLFDVFFASMAVTIMAGLGFASILTLIGVPALYQTYLRKERLAERRARELRAPLEPSSAIHLAAE